MKTDCIHVFISEVQVSELPEILELQKKAFYSEAVLYNNFNIHPMCQALEEISEEFKGKVFLKASINNRIVGSVRASWAWTDKNVCFIEKLFVHPEFQRKGIGRKLLEGIQEHFPKAGGFELATGKFSVKNIRLYEKAGFRIYKEKKMGDITLVFMKKSRTGIFPDKTS